MGLFENFFNKVTDRASTNSGHSIERSVLGLKANSKIIGNIPIQKLLAEYQMYKKIGFGIECAADRDKLYQLFQIEKDEVVVAIISGKSTFGFSKIDRLVMTDKALYTHPSIVEEVKNKKTQLIHCDNMTNRFPICDFCKYILYAPLKYNAVMFVNHTGVFLLDKKNVIKAALSQNEDEKSLYSMIKNIQQSLCDISEDARKDRKLVLDWLSSKANDEISQGCISEDVLQWIEHLKNEEKDNTIWVKLLLKNALYLYDRKLLVEYAKEVSTGMNTTEEEDMLTEFQEMCAELIESFKHINRGYNVDLLKHIQIKKSFFSEKLEKYVIKDTSFEERLVHIFDTNRQKMGVYMAIWKYPETDLRLIQSYLEEQGWSQAEIKEVLQLTLCIRNWRMREVFAAIQKNEKFDEQWTDWIDGFGFTPLHYAILLNNSQKVEEIVELLRDRKSRQDLQEELMDVYDYGVLCAFTGNTEYINDIVIFSRETQPLVENRKKMQFILKVKQTAYNASKKGLRNIEASYRRARNSDKYNVEQLQRIEGQINEAKDRLFEFEMEIEALEDDIEQIETDIYLMGKFLFSKYSELANRIREGQTVHDRMLRNMYSSPESLYEALNAKETEYRIYQFLGVYFNIPEDMFREGDNKESKQRFEGEGKRSETGSYQKPYGEHWFSDAAYTYINVLRKEYHVLVAKYHPDNNPNGVGAFLDIQNERAIILENLKER